MLLDQINALLDFLRESLMFFPPVMVRIDRVFLLLSFVIFLTFVIVFFLLLILLLLILLLLLYLVLLLLLLLFC